MDPNEEQRLAEQARQDQTDAQQRQKNAEFQRWANEMTKNMGYLYQQAKAQMEPSDAAWLMRQYYLQVTSNKSVPGL